MDLINVEKIPVSVRGKLQKYVNSLIEDYGKNIESVFAYGSVTGVDWEKKTSDINLAVVVKEASIGELKKGLKNIKSGFKNNITAPLFLTPAYIKMSLDSFPMEFMSMKDSRCLLFGEDIMADIEVKKEDLRRECEYQIKGKIVAIRQAYLEQALSRKGLECIIKKSFKALIPVFQNLIRLKEGNTPPQGKEDILVRLGELCGVDVSSFIEVLKDKKTDGKIGERSAEEFLEEFLSELQKLSEIVDKLEV